MAFYSPLRYPGGKNKLANFIKEVCDINAVDGHYVEPYAGGASVALHLLIEDYVSKITINDIDRSIYAFWYSVLNDTEKFCRKVENTDITIKEWKKQREVQKNKDSEKSLFKLGFSTFFLNRTNYSGVIDGGVIGGIAQEGPYKLDCRFNKKVLIDRIQQIARHKDRILINDLDAMDLLDEVEKDKNTIFYFDPPYFLKGQSLYMNAYKSSNHKEVGKKIAKIKNAHWIVSYDNVKEIEKLYKDFSSIKYTFNHSAHSPREGREILIFSKKTAIPDIKNPAKA